jgi:hypothetical protein
MSNTTSNVWKLTPEINKRIDLFLEDIYPASEEMGKRMVCLDTSQVRGLENLIVSTSRFSEIINYIKNQAGKDTKNKSWTGFAEDMLHQLKNLENKAWEIGGTDAEAVLEIKLKLARGWAKQVVSHYLYEKNLKGGKT